MLNRAFSYKGIRESARVLPIAVSRGIRDNWGVAGSPGLKGLLALIIWGWMVTGPVCALERPISQIPNLTESLANRLLEQGFTEEAIARIFSDPRVKLYPHIVERRGKGINYLDKKFGLLTKKSVARGRQVLLDNDSFFDELERLYGVEREAVAAIFRLETNLGRYMGSYPVFNSLLTMAALPNRRSQWAEDELVYLLVMCRALGRDPFSIKGSWAGAFGLCQFVPSSFVAHAVDGNDDGVVDLFNFFDAMASIESYLKANGWHTDDRTGKEKAIYAYNHCESYVKAVLAYAKAISTDS